MSKIFFKKINNFVVFLLFLLILFCNPTVFAQQTIINVPSSDVIPAGDILLKDSNRLGSFSTGTRTSVTPSFTIGIGKGMELSTGVATSIDSNRDTTVRGNLSTKKVFFWGSSTRLTVGGTLSPYFTESLHPDTFLYTHVSQRIRKTKTTLTIGGYMNGQQHFLNTGGLILGVEQVILTSKLSVAADWLSGEDSMGRVGVGIKYRPIPTVSITSAVIIPNTDLDNIAFNVSFSKFISVDNENPIKRRLTNVD